MKKNLISGFIILIFVLLFFVLYFLSREKKYRYYADGFQIGIIESKKYPFLARIFLRNSKNVYYWCNANGEWNSKKENHKFPTTSLELIVPIISMPIPESVNPFNWKPNKQYVLKRVVKKKELIKKSHHEYFTSLFNRYKNSKLIKPP